MPSYTKHKVLIVLVVLVLGEHCQKSESFLLGNMHGWCFDSFRIWNLELYIDASPLSQDRFSTLISPAVKGALNWTLNTSLP